MSLAIPRNIPALGWWPGDDEVPMHGVNRACKEPMTRWWQEVAGTPFQQGLCSECAAEERAAFHSNERNQRSANAGNSRHQRLGSDGFVDRLLSRCLDGVESTRLESSCSSLLLCDVLAGIGVRVRWGEVSRRAVDHKRRGAERGGAVKMAPRGRTEDAIRQMQPGVPQSRLSSRTGGVGTPLCDRNPW